MQNTQSETVSDYVNIVLVHPGDHPELAVDYLSRKLLLSRDAVQHLMCAGDGVISQNVPRDEANKQITLMSVIGMQVIIADSSDKKPVSLFDVSVRRTSWSSIKKLRRKLKRLGLPQKLKAADFHGPVGLEICGLTQKSSLKHKKLLEKIDGVTVTICSQEAALFDVMSTPGLTPVEEAEIHDFAVALGCGAISGHEMLATGLSRDQFAQLTARFPNAQLVCANRAFERIDLYVTGLGTVSVENLLEFAAWYGQTAAKAASAGQRYRVETNLSRPEARLAFERLIAIGLEFRAEWYPG